MGSDEKKRMAVPTANILASKQKEISITEFFEKNKQILGFDSKSKSLLMGVKEAVDNALDACEEADILPDVSSEWRGLRMTNTDGDRGQRSRDRQEDDA